MKINEMLLPEFDQEIANTRKTIERIPEEKLSWKPHPKSWSLGELVTHIVNLPNWMVETLTKDKMDIGSSGNESTPPRQTIASSKEALELFEKNVAHARDLLSQATNEQLMAPWSLVNNGKTVFTMPRLSVLRHFVMNHLIHHRAQLTVYLRLNNVPVPALYGPSADEGGI
ncbi:MAG: DinB family protein [Calditrichaeota bacterium]|nr:MAG: DinB family protein [Calditrichota bacterium]